MKQNMRQENVLRDKSYRFALRIIGVYQYLCDDKKEFVLSKQLLRSGSSIGANVEEANGGQSEKDFFAKAFHYWRTVKNSSK